MSLVLATLDATASLIGLATLLGPQVPIPDHVFQLAITLAGLPCAAGLLWLRHRFNERLPSPLIHAWVVGNVVMICLGSWSARTAPTAIASLAFFVWIGLFVGHFFPTRQVLWHLSWIAACLSVLLVVNGDRATASVGIMMFGIVVAATGASHYLSHLLRRVAVTDALTGLPNRQALDGLFEREIAAAHSGGTALAVALIDVDHFKTINDHHGHLAGDDALVSFAAHLRAGLRKTDTMVRYGGDEFVVVMPGCDIADAKDLFDQLRTTSALPTSTGLTSWAPGDGAYDLLHRADQALYRAKSEGRNQVALFCGPQALPPKGSELPGGHGDGASTHEHRRPPAPRYVGRGEQQGGSCCQDNTGSPRP